MSSFKQCEPPPVHAACRMLARDAGIGRESLYKVLAPGAKPRYDTILKLLPALGIQLHARPV